MACDLLLHIGEQLHCLPVCFPGQRNLSQFVVLKDKNLFIVNHTFLLQELTPIVKEGKYDRVVSPEKIPILMCPDIWVVIFTGRSEPRCSKLTMLLVNVSLKFQTQIYQICQYFLLKNVSFSLFFNKKYHCIW